MVLIASLEKVRYLHYGVAAVLAFAAFKLMTHEWIPVAPMVSVGIIVVILTTTVLVSLHAARKDKPADKGHEHS